MKQVKASPLKTQLSVVLVPREYIGQQSKKVLEEAMENGVVAGYPLVDIKAIRL